VHKSQIDKQIDRNEPKFRAYKVGHYLEYSEKFISLSDFFTDYKLNEYRDLEYCLNINDIKGDLIYENDIVEDKYGKKFIIRWCEMCCAFEIDENLIDTFFDHFSRNYYKMIDKLPKLPLKIIGNKYETPELWMRLKNEQ
jgi:hypothetical protein